MNCRMGQLRSMSVAAVAAYMRARSIRQVACGSSRVDISAAELAENRDVAETCLADIAGDLPIESGSVDLVLSRALLGACRRCSGGHQKHGACAQA